MGNRGSRKEEEDSEPSIRDKGFSPNSNNGTAPVKKAEAKPIGLGGLVELRVRDDVVENKTEPNWFTGDDFDSLTESGRLKKILGHNTSEPGTTFTRVDSIEDRALISIISKDSPRTTTCQVTPRESMRIRKSMTNSLKYQIKSPKQINSPQRIKSPHKRNRAEIDLPKGRVWDSVKTDSLSQNRAMA
mmetsp:Transcript_6086/g.7456  ORF Transcript_6086/g.7456 Transcript_6086/m.7456 type:complete len:188 (-) Transcript_6086:454-1017(-)|eukprot:jgi/Bigna1/85708/estExt_fgenesh1_pg.C_50280